MEGNANNSSIKRGGKHEPVNIVQHQKITEAIKAQSEVERIMAETRESNFEELDEILGVLDSGRRRSSPRSAPTETAVPRRPARSYAD